VNVKAVHRPGIRHLTLGYQGSAALGWHAAQDFIFGIGRGFV
jgi:hypothetical protein